MSEELQKIREGLIIKKSTRDCPDCDVRIKNYIESIGWFRDAQNELHAEVKELRSIIGDLIFAFENYDRQSLDDFKMTSDRAKKLLGDVK